MCQPRALNPRPEGRRALSGRKDSSWTWDRWRDGWRTFGQGSARRLARIASTRPKHARICLRRFEIGRTQSHDRVLPRCELGLAGSGTALRAVSGNTNPRAGGLSEVRDAFSSERLGEPGRAFSPTVLTTRPPSSWFANFRALDLKGHHEARGPHTTRVWSQAAKPGRDRLFAVCCRLYIAPLRR
jgi:hypothetical protein